MKILFFLISVLAVFAVAERQSLIVNSSLVMANLAQDMTHYSGELKWVVRYNEAIWLSDSGRYSEAKVLIAPLLNDTTIEKKSEIAELYGDLIYTTSGSIDDTVRMYERSLSFAPSDRVIAKIAYIKQNQKTGSGNTDTSTKTDSGSMEREARKVELQKIGENRDQYLGNSVSSRSGVRSDLQRLVESIQSSGSVSITQDW